MIKKRRLSLITPRYYRRRKKSCNTIKHNITYKSIQNIENLEINRISLKIDLLLNIKFQFLKMSQQPKPASQNIQDKVYSRQQYARATFWQDRYVQNGGFFDWYAEFPELQPAFKQYGIMKDYKILMVGCGNSKLSDQMYQNGYKNIINIDISPSVIDQMKEKFPHMVWEVMDATKMSYKDGQFDIILDKGTLDALISGKNYDICQEMLKQCMRVTKQTGQMILITYGSPQGRRKIFENALPFDKYDYYQCRAELNDISTMINLMRSNLPGQQLSSIIKQQQAFARTMKEFTIIKMMRRNRKNQKQYIVWKKNEETEIEHNSAHLQQAPNESKEKQIKKQDNAQQQVKKQQTEAKKPFNYQPKKQPYVFVYSIRRKFTLGMDQLLQNQTQQALNSQWSKEENEDLKLNGHADHQPLTFFVDQTVRRSVQRAVKYLIKKEITCPTILITNSSSQRSIQESLKINAIQGKTSNMLCLRKTNFQLKISLNSKNKLENVFDQIKKIRQKLIDKCDLHPSPKAYALFGVLKNRKILPTVNELLNKYWFPTWRILSVTDNYLSVEFSLPPLLQGRQEDALSVLVGQLKPYKVQVGSIRAGFISYIDLELYNIVSGGCLSYTNERINLIIDEFWNQDEVSSSINPTKFLQNTLYNEITQTILLNCQISERVIAHIIGLY